MAVGKALSEAAGKELANQVKTKFGAGIALSGATIQLKNGLTTKGVIGSATIPTGANGQLGLVKTTSNVSDATGYTAVPIIGGVPYYKDTNTTYSDMKGATSAEAGAHGLVPAPATGNQGMFLRGDGTWASPENTTYGVASTTANGLLSKEDKAKLDGIATGANKTVVDTELSATSTNPVQNKAVNAAVAAKAPLASPALTGTPTAPTAALGTNSTQVATTAFVQSAVSNMIVSALVYKGAANKAEDITGAAYKVGNAWVVGTAGTYAGQVCEVGDMIIANKDKGSAYADSDFDVLQSNIDYVSAADVQTWF